MTGFTFLSVVSTIVPSAPPQDITVNPISSNSISVTWRGLRAVPHALLLRTIGTVRRRGASGSLFPPERNNPMKREFTRSRAHSRITFHTVRKSNIL